MAPPSSGHTQLAIIGSGLAGLSAALFACSRGLHTTLLGGRGATHFSSGLLDLLGAKPGPQPQVIENPWQAIQELSSSHPLHPYTRIAEPDIQDAFAELFQALKACGLHFVSAGGHNVRVLGPLGTTKPTYWVPAGMWTGVQAMSAQEPCLFVDFHGLKDFSARMIHSMLQPDWPQTRSARIHFPGMNGRSELSTLLLAQALETPATRRDLAAAIRPLLRTEKALGLPAVLGLYTHQQVMAELEQALGVSVFEIPTLPASVPGLRLTEGLQGHLAGLGVHIRPDAMVHTVIRDKDTFHLQLGSATDQLESPIQAQQVILASGRFVGQGLAADRQHMFEPLFDLPVHQPDTRSAWHDPDFFTPCGHRANQAGLEVDARFRPVDRSGDPVVPDLFACGSILAHQDWMRMKCGAGVAVATAYAAVQAICARAQGLR